MRSRFALLLAVGVLSGAVLAPARALVGTEARVQVALPQTHMMSVRTYDASGALTGYTPFRVVNGTGNCCENYLAATPTGRLLDLGGDYVHYTDDKGVTWRRVVPDQPLLGAEGAIAVAPNGDVVAITWTPYAGDRVVSYKWEAATKRWLTAEVVVHGPAFDRPWIGVIPGPFAWGAFSGEYLTVIRGGVVASDILYVSFDGLQYVKATQALADVLADRTEVPVPQPRADASLDWTGAHASAGISALPGRDALFTDAHWCSYGITTPDTSWRCSDFRPGLFGRGMVKFDSRGVMHRLVTVGSALVYEVSTDAGKTTSTRLINLPPGMHPENVEFRVNGALAMAAIAVHAHDQNQKTDQDLLYELSVPAVGQPAVQRMYRVGAGDLEFSAGIGAELRFDFATLAILPDGSIATSFVDAAHRNPAVAIRL